MEKRGNCLTVWNNNVFSPLFYDNLSTILTQIKTKWHKNYWLNYQCPKWARLHSIHTKPLALHGTGIASSKNGAIICERLLTCAGPGNNRWYNCNSHAKSRRLQKLFFSHSKPLKPLNDLSTHPPWINSTVFRLVGSPFAYPSPPVGMFNQIQRWFVFYGHKKDFFWCFFQDEKCTKGKF